MDQFKFISTQIVKVLEKIMGHKQLYTDSISTLSSI